MPSPVRHRIQARPPASFPAPPVDSDPDLLSSYLADAAHVPGGFAGGVAFPSDADQASALVAASSCVLAVGAQSSLTGGATPRGGLVLSTRALTTIGEPLPTGVRDRAGRELFEVRAGAGVPLKALQHTLAGRGLYYPPVPTYDGAFVGGTVATNAAGAATFKYGTTRAWVEALTVVLADGQILDLRRGAVLASADGTFEIESASGAIVTVPIPHYSMPAVPKLSAGYFAVPGMDLVDLFVGSEGTLGVIVDATLRVIRRPLSFVALVECSTEPQALAATAVLRLEAAAA